MTVQFDDAGWGDLLGGVVISGYRVETGRLGHRVIDVRFFQDPLFDRKDYLEEVSVAVQDMLLKTFEVSGNESILICTGYVLSKAVRDLRERGLNVSTGKITGLLQEFGEKKYAETLKEIGYEALPDRESSVGMRRKSFYHMLNWMKIDLDHWKLAKTGWSLFHPEKRGERWSH